MISLVKLGARVRGPPFFWWPAMSKNNEKVYYAVGRGRETGVYESWKDCKEQVDGISNAKYRKFFSLDEANEFVEFWSNYESPSKNPDGFKDSVSTSRKKRKISFDSDKRPSGKSSPVSRRKGFVLGIDAPEKSVKEQVALAPYTSPFAWSQVYHDLNQKLRHHNINGNRYSSQPENGHLKTDRNSRKNNQSQSLNSISTPKTNNKIYDTFESAPEQAALPVIRKTESVSESDNIANNDLISQVAKTIKTEVVEVEQTTGSDESEELLEINNKLSSCLDILKQGLSIINKQPTKGSEKVLNQMKNLLLGLFSSTNASINPQMEIEEANSKGTTNEEQEKAVHETTPSPPPPVPQQQQQTTPLSSSSGVLEINSNHLSTPSFDQRSVDIMALNLRMDAFEKRFDACLKEIGAITCEISNIKAELKDLKGSPGGSTSYSPRKSKEGLFQPTLNFKSNYAKKNECQNSIRSYTTSSDSSEKKTGKSLKRKLSRSDSENTKRNKDDEEEEEEDDTDGLLSKIKVESVDYTSFNVDVHEYVEVYTDGACHSNGKNNAKAGIGIWFGDSHPLNVSEPVDGSPTNNSAEIQAARVAIELAIKAGISKLKILTDSEFLINCATKWIHRWKKNGWTLVNGGQVKNRKELEKLDAVASKISVRWEKVEAHKGIAGNEMADRLANEGAARYCR